MSIFINILFFLSLNSLMIFDFSLQSDLNDWLVVNDDVMGGRSEADLRITEEGIGLFQGKVSLENNGGFSSIRYRMNTTSTEDHTHLVIRLKGDGKRYQVRIRENRNDYYSYIAYFSTSGEWETIRVPLKSMYPSFRGRKLNSPNYNGPNMVELSLLIGNKKAESFEIKLDKIYLE